MKAVRIVALTLCLQTLPALSIYELCADPTEAIITTIGLARGAKISYDYLQEQLALKKLKLSNATHDMQALQGSIDLEAAEESALEPRITQMSFAEITEQDRQRKSRILSYADLKIAKGMFAACSFACAYGTYNLASCLLQ